VVHNVKVIEGKNGVFIAMPSRKTKTGEYKDIVHPISSDFRSDLQNKIIDAYHALPTDSEIMPESEMDV
jgi:stage V sporulation protein G